MTPERIIEIVAEKFDVSIDLITGKRRNKTKVSDARFAAMHFIRENINDVNVVIIKKGNVKTQKIPIPLKGISKYFSGRYHATIINALKKFKYYYTSGCYDNEILDQIEKQILKEVIEAEIKAFVEAQETINKTHFAA